MTASGTRIAPLLALLSACGATPATDPASAPPPDADAPDLVHADAGCELRIWYRAKGTRSEGQHGVLVIDGAVVAGTPDEVRDTPLGRLRFYGPVTDGAPWAPSGWNFLDASRIRRSWEVPDGR